MENFKEAFDVIRNRKKELGSTFRELADESGYSWSTIHKWLNYKNNIGLVQFFDLLKVLGLRMKIEVDDE
jgi:hypothetical protein